MEDIKAIEIKNLKVVGSIDLQWITEFTMDIFGVTLLIQ